MTSIANKKIILFFLFFTLYISPFVHAGSIDSLKLKLEEQKNDEAKIPLLGDLCWEYLLTGNFDTALFFGHKELAFAQAINDDKFISQAFSDIGSVYYSKGDYQNSIASYISSLEIRIKINDTLGVGKNYNNLGAVYQRMGDNSTALDYFLKSIKVFERTDNKAATGAILNNIAEIYRFKKDYQTALEYFEKSLKLKEEVGDVFQITGTLSNIGMIYGDQGKISESLAIFKKSLAKQKEINDRVGTASSYLNIGILLRESGEFQKSLQYYDSSLQVSLEIGDKHTIGLVYNSIGNAYLGLKKYAFAAENFLLGLSNGEENRSMETMMKSYQGLAYANYELSNFNKAYEYHLLYSDMKDSIFNETSSEQVAEMQTRYETEKKEKEIALQKTQIEIQDSENKKQKIIILSVAFGLLLVMLFAGFVFRSLRITRKQKHIIEIQKDEVTRQKVIVEGQKEIVEIQKDEITHKNKELTDSINYAQRIQQAILTSEQYLNSMFLPGEQSASHFILFKPKDIVAGDFYWAFQAAPSICIWVVSDCTGHGVPGAFMSMIGNSLLNEIVVEKKIFEPDEILNNLREGIIKALGQGLGGDEKRKDGMDAAICCWDKSTNTLSFSGANNCLWIVRNSPSASKSLIEDEVKNSPSPLEKWLGDEVNSPSLLERGSGGEVIELAADSQPVGQHIVMKPFTKKEIQLQKGDTLYSFTDGYCDQFGGPKGKKFKYKPFKELLISIQDRTMPEQREILNKTIEEWKKNLEQVDDICVMGVRV